MKYLTLALVLLLSACSTAKLAYHETLDTIEDATDSGKNLSHYHACPSVFVSEDLGFYHDYAGDLPHLPKNIKSAVELSVESSDCEFENNSVIVDAQFNFAGQLGPKGRLLKTDAPLYSYPFFVAITDRGGKILTKQLFAATMPYPSGSIDGSYSENIRQIIPVPSQSRARNYAVIAGFQLDDQQLIENRAFLAEQKRIAEEELRKAVEEAKKNGTPLPDEMQGAAKQVVPAGEQHYNQ